MKKNLLLLFLTGCFITCATSVRGQINIEKDVSPGNAKPIYVSLSGISGEAAQVIQFDLYVQGFAFTNAEGAQYLISGSNNGNLQGQATDAINKSVLVS